MKRCFEKSIDENEENESFVKNPMMDKLGIGYMDRFFEDKAVGGFSDERINDLLQESHGEMEIARDEALSHMGNLGVLTRTRLSYCLKEIGGLNLNSFPIEVQSRIIDTISQIERVLRTKVCA